MKLRKLSSLLLVLVLILAMVPSALADEPVTLRFLMFQDSNFDNRVAAREKYLEKYFYPDNPNIKIEYEYIPFNDMESKAITSFAGGVSYDLMIVNHPAIVQYKEAGMLLPLNDYLKSSGIDFDSYFSASIAKCGVFDGTVYSIPRDNRHPRAGRQQEAV